VEVLGVEVTQAPALLVQVQLVKVIMEVLVGGALEMLLVAVAVVGLELLAVELPEIIMGVLVRLLVLQVHQ
jgi:hypothetical protein